MNDGERPMSGGERDASRARRRSDVDDVDDVHDRSVAGDAYRSTDVVRSVDRVALDDVTCGFDGTPVLSGVDLAVERGEVVAVIGPSGTGKTTLLRTLALFRRPDAGTVRVDGADAWTLSDEDRLAARRRIGFVFQQPNLFDGTIRRNVTYGLRVRRQWGARIRATVDRLLGDPEMDPAVEDALSLVGLDGNGDQPVTELSGGEAQRVAFARALAVDPDLLLLDEPTSELDPRNTAVIEDAIGRARDDGIGIAIATHDMHQAERVADRVAVVLGGELIEIGPAERVFTDPDDERARKFIDGELVY